MKKLLFAAVAAFCFTGLAEQAKVSYSDVSPTRAVDGRVTPFSLSLVPSVALPWGADWNVCGLQLGFWGQVDYFEGIQACPINVADECSGLQIGVVNFARRMYGVQIGLVNVIQDSDIPFLPLVNCWF